MTFDPYYEWLGIPPDEQPPDYYRLLGIRSFESNSNAIENAAERQLLLLKTFQNGPHGVLTQQLMNEVSSARVCLLDAGKKAGYDAALRHRPHVGAPPRKKTAPQPTVVASDRAEDFASAPLSPTRRPLVSAETRRVTKPVPRRQPAKLAWASLGVQVAFGGVAAVCVVIVVLWLFLGRDPFNIWQRGAEQRDLAQGENAPAVEREGRAPASNSRRNVPPRPPLGSLDRRTPQPGQGESPSPGRVAGALTGNLQNPRDVTGPLTPGLGTGLPIRESGNVPIDPPGESGTQASMEPSTSGGGTFGGDPVPGPAGRPAPFSNLLDALDIAGEASGAGSAGVTLGTISSSSAAQWQVTLEDYAGLLGDSRFTVGQSAMQGDLVRWPLLRTAVAVGDSPAAAPEGTVAQATTAEQSPVGYLEARGQALTLRFPETPSTELLQQLRVCRLIVQQGQDRHGIQLSVPRRVAPLEISFDESTKEVVLGEVPELSDVSTDRVLFSVVQAAVGQTPLVANVDAGLNEELVITLDEQLECELGVRLVEKGGEFRILLAPRSTLTGRRLPLVSADIEKDLARAKSQLAENQRELTQAKSQLSALPAEYNRVRRITPNSPQEATMQQVRLSQLDKIAKSLQSRVRRLSEAIPKLTANMDQLNRVLQATTTLSGQVTVQYRIYARGNSGDFELVQSSSQNSPDLSNRSRARRASSDEQRLATASPLTREPIGNLHAARAPAN